MEIFKTDIREKREFERYGFQYTLVKEDNDNRIYVFKVEKKGEKPLPYENYEIVKGKKEKNPDGTVVYTYPSTEQFGKYGYYICGTPKACEERLRIRYEELCNLK